MFLSMLCICIYFYIYLCIHFHPTKTLTSVLSDAVGNLSSTSIGSSDLILRDSIPIHQQIPIKTAQLNKLLHKRTCSLSLICELVDGLVESSVGSVSGNYSLLRSPVPSTSNSSRSEKLSSTYSSPALNLIEQMTDQWY